MQSHLFIDNFSSKIATEKVCSGYIVIGENYLQLAVKLQDELSFIFCKTWYNSEGNITKEYFDILLLEPALKQCTHFFVCIDTPKFVEVPTSFLSKENNHLFFENLQIIESDEQILEQKISKEITELFVAKKATIQMLKNQWNDVKILSNSACLLTQNMKLVTQNWSLFVHTNQTGFFLSLFEKNKLYLHNFYEMSNEEDVLYAVMNVMVQKEIEMKNLQFYLTGFAQNQQNIYELLSTYIQVQTIENEEMKKQLFPTHILFNLYSFMLCAS